METKQIAETILQQLGGNQFVAMTGAKNFGYEVRKNGNPSLSFKIGKNSANINHVRIELNSMDLYEIEFIKVRKLIPTIVKKYSGVYDDMLQTLFTNTTGLYTHL